MSTKALLNDKALHIYGDKLLDRQHLVQLLEYQLREWLSTKVLWGGLSVKREPKLGGGTLL